MADAVAASGVPAAVNFGFTTDAVARSVAAAVQCQTLGPPVRASLEVRFPRWPRDWQAGAGSWLATPGEGGLTREVISHFAYLADRLLGPGVVTGSRVERRDDGLEEQLDATVTYGVVPFEIQGSIGEGSDDVYRFVLECRDGTISIDDWQNLTGIPITEPDEPTTAAFAALLDGERRDLADFAAGARVVEVIDGLLR
jgi:predicted dehydrogenase